MAKKLFILYLILNTLYLILNTRTPVFAQPTPVPTNAVDICQNLSASQKDACYACVGRLGEPVTGKSWTVFGCWPAAPAEFAGIILKYAVTAAGVLALFLIIFAGFQMMTAAGDPAKIERGRDLLISAVVGLLIVVFSVVILQVIGVTILEIPGFPKFGK